MDVIALSSTAQYSAAGRIIARFASFVEKQRGSLWFCVVWYGSVCSDDDKLNYHILQLAIELTNLMQTLSFSSNYVVYALLNVKFRHALHDVVCCCLAPAADMTAARGHPLIEMGEAGNNSRRRHSTYVSRPRPHVEIKTTVHHTTSV